MSNSFTGLSPQDVQTRRQRGQHNAITLKTSRSYWQILVDNLFTFVNMALLIIGVMLVALGLPQDAFTTTGLVVINVIVALSQEIYAKRKLDKIALLTRPSVTIIRESKEITVDPGEIVLDEIIILKAGDQVMCDGELLQGEVEMDESLVTGESDSIFKKSGDTLFSGSVCISGSAVYRATKVGAESFANRITAKARVLNVVATPLQIDVNRVVR
ncbi:MAG TPA: cation-transporting P-type ATPase, partial [Aggregatilineales bacterium]|nr:cation-transporting P-type ATPase [Aggregatilineales bacterium]